MRNSVLIGMGFAFLACALTVTADQPAPAAGKKAQSQPASKPASQPASQPTSKPAKVKPAKAPAEAVKDAPKPTAEEQKEIDEQIARLGEKDWKAREEATKKLQTFGLKAKPALEAKAKEKGLDPEIASRIELILDEMPGNKSVTDAASGITVSVGDGGTSVQAHKDGKNIWKVMVGGNAVKTLKITGGQVRADPAGWVIDLQTGKILQINGGGEIRRRGIGGAVINLNVGANRD